MSTRHKPILSVLITLLYSNADNNHLGRTYNEILHVQHRNE